MSRDGAYNSIHMRNPALVDIIDWRWRSDVLTPDDFTILNAELPVLADEIEVVNATLIEDQPGVAGGTGPGTWTDFATHLFPINRRAPTINTSSSSSSSRIKPPVASTIVRKQ